MPDLVIFVYQPDPDCRTIEIENGESETKEAPSGFVAPLVCERGRPDQWPLRLFRKTSMSQQDWKLDIVVRLVHGATVFVPPEQSFDLLAGFRAQPALQPFRCRFIRAERLMMREQKALLRPRRSTFACHPAHLLAIEFADAALEITRIEGGVEYEDVPIQLSSRKYAL
jgi:hypothetical protein